jgi:GH24 family phage-related lysozyme (muramidase)
MPQIIDPPNPNFSKDFLSFIKEQEGLVKDPKTGSLVYKSLEGGTPTVGYGHKLTPNEIKTKKVKGRSGRSYDLSKLTEDQAEDILISDLQKKQQTLNSSLINKYGIGLSELDNKRQEMLLDYEFNLGNALGVFPSFSKAVLSLDAEEMKKQYERSYFDPKENKRKPLKKRNIDFFNRYLK